MTKHVAQRALDLATHWTMECSCGVRFAGFYPEDIANYFGTHCVEEYHKNLVAELDADERQGPRL